jgi:hypothetical protein
MRARRLIPAATTLNSTDRGPASCFLLLPSHSHLKKALTEGQKSENVFRNQPEKDVMARTPDQ